MFLDIYILQGSVTT